MPTLTDSTNGHHSVATASARRLGRTRPVRQATIVGQGSENVTRLAVIDNDPSAHCLVRQAAHTFPRRCVVQSYTSPEAALRGISRNPPDAALMEICYSGLSGLDYVSKVKALAPRAHIIVFTSAAAAECILLSLMAGAIGYLIKPTMTDDLAHALADAMDGHAAMCAEAERKLLECLWRAGSGSAFEVLTRREREIMSQLIANSSDKELAERCRIAPNTVHVHLVRIFRKLGVHSREQALNKFLSVPSLVVSDTIRSEEAT